MAHSTQPSNLDKKKMQITQQIFHLIIEVSELYPQYTLCQHFAGFLRRKSTDKKEFYHWSIEDLLKSVENYKAELLQEDLSNQEGEGN